MIFRLIMQINLFVPIRHRLANQIEQKNYAEYQQKRKYQMCAVNLNFFPSCHDKKIPFQLPRNIAPTIFSDDPIVSIAPGLQSFLKVDEGRP